MPINYALRTPLYAKAQSSGTATASAQLLVIVNSVTVYTIVKPAEPNVNVIFEVAELLRDYLDIIYTGTPQKISFVTNIQFFNQPNAEGTAQGSPVNTVSGDGWEAYSVFADGANSTIPFSYRSRPTWLLAKSYPNTTSTLNDDYYIYVPVGVSGSVSWVNYTGTVASAVYNTTQTSLFPTGGIELTIVRVDCTKYGIGNKISFINRYGVMQDLWFFLRKSDSISRSNENYKSNTLTTAATYSDTNAPIKLFNTQAKQTRTLSSGYYPEWANEYFEQLLLSEYVWITTVVPWSGQTEQFPVIVKTSNISFKTSVNDRLIEYTMEFEDAFDYINNVR